MGPRTPGSAGAAPAPALGQPSSESLSRAQAQSGSCFPTASDPSTGQGGRVLWEGWGQDGKARTELVADSGGWGEGGLHVNRDSVGSMWRDGVAATTALQRTCHGACANPFTTVTRASATSEAPTGCGKLLLLYL